MFLDRRTVLGAAGLTALAGPAAASGASAAALAVAGIDAQTFGLEPDSTADQSAKFQRALQSAAEQGRPLVLAPGRYRVGKIVLPNGTQLCGVPGASILEYAGGGTFLAARETRSLRLDGILLDGVRRPLDPANGDGLLNITGCKNLVLAHVTVQNSLLNGISLRSSQAAVTDCQISECGNTGLFALDGRDSRFSGLTVSHCGNNGIQVWRSNTGEDGTVVANNHIHHIAARAGGEGQNGNGVNVYRAGSVSVNNNRITDCAFTAIRGNAASNIQMVANHCERLGEVALYAEFAFEGALIANNLVDRAASGISVTNFNDGGRLAVVQGNLVRHLAFRDHPRDRRGIGIHVEADTAVTGNVIEGAPDIGLLLGWGHYMANVAATSNVIRQARIGIGITSHPRAGAAFVTGNMIAETTDGAIRLVDQGRESGPDLARAQPGPQPNLTVFGNVAV